MDPFLLRKLYTNVLVFKLEVPFWSSLSYIQAENINCLKSLLGSFSVIDLLHKDLVKVARSYKSDLWVFPEGTCQASLLDWLPKNLNRPPALFFLTGEGTKICYNLWRLYPYFRKDDRWVVSCQSEKALIDFFFPNNRRTFVVNKTIDTSTFKPSKNSYRNLFKLPPKGLIGLYAGRISLQKNVLDLVDFSIAYPDTHLAICGDFDSIGFPHFKSNPLIHLPTVFAERIRQFGLNERFTFVPFQSQANLAKLMQSVDFQISLSSHYGEDFGYSIAQGLCTGLPSILSDWGGHKNWKALPDKSVSFVGITFDRLGLGKPHLPAGLKIPKTPINNFAKSYNKQVRASYQGLLTSPPANEYVTPSEDLLRFWKNRKSQYLFATAKDPMFKKVLKLYND